MIGFSNPTMIEAIVGKKLQQNASFCSDGLFFNTMLIISNIVDKFNYAYWTYLYWVPLKWSIT